MLRGACGRLPDACRAAQAAGPLPCPLPLPARRPHHAGQSDKATLLQASWKRRSVQGKFQSAVGELMEINGLIEGIADKEKDLEERQNFTALKIEKAMKIAEMEEPPPKMPTDREMADPKKMQATYPPTYPPTHPHPTPPSLSPLLSRPPFARPVPRRLLPLRVAARARALSRPGPHAADAGDCRLTLTLTLTLTLYVPGVHAADGRVLCAAAAQALGHGV